MAIFTFLFNTLKAAYFVAYLTWVLLPFVLAGWAALMVTGKPPFVIGMIAAHFIAGWVIQYEVRKLLAYFRKPSTAHGSARFATAPEMAAAGLFASRGLILGRKGLRWIRYNKEGHVLTFAPSRSGKGAGGVIPNLLEHPGSAVVIDVKGENHAITARDRSTRGDIHVLAPLREDIPCASYNPLDFIRLGTLNAVADAALIADLIVSPVGEDTYFDEEARHMIAALVLYVASEAPENHRTLAQVADLATSDAEGFNLLLSYMEHAKTPAVKARAKAFSQKEVRERSAVISTVQNHLAVWTSQHPLARVTAHSDFQFEDLKGEPATVYIVLPPELLNVYRSFVRVMVGLAIASMTRDGKRPRNRVLFLLDEVAALGRMPVIEQAIGFIAGYGVSLWLFFQDLDQLQKTYAKWRSVIANCAVRQAFNVADAQTARELSAMCGTQTVQVDSEGRSAAFPFTLLPHSLHKGTSHTSRPLLTDDEVMAMGGDQQLIFVQGMRPIQARKIRYFDWWEWRFQGRYDRWTVEG